MHLDVDQIERVIHGELRGSTGERAQSHLAECAQCQAAVERARDDEREIMTLLGELEPARPVRLAAVLGAAAATRSPHWLARAATLAAVVVLGGAAAYALPSSPLRRWFETRRAPALPAPGPSRMPQAQEPQVTGVSVTPDPSMIIVFRERQRRGDVLVRLIEGPEIAVRASANGSRFSVAPGRLTIANNGLATYEVDVPASVPRVEIVVAGSRLWLKEGPRTIPETGSRGVHLSLSP